VKGKKGEANSKQAAPITIWGFHENTTNRVYFPAKHADFFCEGTGSLSHLQEFIPAGIVSKCSG
jgi:hypothetical protein